MTVNKKIKMNSTSSLRGGGGGRQKGDMAG